MSHSPDDRGGYPMDIDGDRGVIAGGGTSMVEDQFSVRPTIPMSQLSVFRTSDADISRVQEAFGVRVQLEQRVTGRFASEKDRASEKAQFSKRMVRLMKVADMMTAEMKRLYSMMGTDINAEEFASLGEIHATIEVLNAKEKKHLSLHAILETHPLEQFERSAAWKGAFFPEPLNHNALLLNFPENQRKELLRQKIFHEMRKQLKIFHELKLEIIDPGNINALLDAIEALETNPTSRYRRDFFEEYPDTKPLDLPISSSPEYTRLHRALVALRNEYEAKLNRNPDIDTITRQTRSFVLGILNAQNVARFSNITDVYGSEPNVPGSENDVTRMRVHEHRREIEEDYGVKLEVFDQGSSIKCPEQCGFYALVSLGQARRKNPGKRIAPRFFALNNAARTEDADQLQSAEASKSTGLVYFTFNLGDGVIHSGTAYGHQTLTYLKPYIEDLYEIQDTDAGTQFRSLEFQQHITTLVAMTGGAFPACYKGKKLNKDEIIPTPTLAKNEYHYMGMDKYGNGVTAMNAKEVFAQFLTPDQQAVKVRVTLLDRKKQPLSGTEPREYTIARSLGLVRDGSPALWESSTPSAGNPKYGNLSIGMFMKKPGDTNPDVISLTPGSIIRIETI